MGSLQLSRKFPENTYQLMAGRETVLFILNAIYFRKYTSVQYIVWNISIHMRTRIRRRYILVSIESWIHLYWTHVPYMQTNWWCSRCTLSGFQQIKPSRYNHPRRWLNSTNHLVRSKWNKLKTLQAIEKHS